jgi:hypothetical protein
MDRHDNNQPLTISASGDASGIGNTEGSKAEGERGESGGNVSPRYEPQHTAGMTMRQSTPPELEEEHSNIASGCKQPTRPAACNAASAWGIHDGIVRKTTTTAAQNNLG